MNHPDLDPDSAQRLLAGDVDPADAPPGYAGVARMLSEAAAPGAPGSSEAEAATVAAMVAAISATPAPGQSPPARSKAGLAHFLSSRVAATAVAGVLVVSGSAAAATGSLPAPAQDALASVARVIGVNLPTSSPSPTSDPAPPAERRPAREQAPEAGSTRVAPDDDPRDTAADETDGADDEAVERTPGTTTTSTLLPTTRFGVPVPPTTTTTEPAPSGPPHAPDELEPGQGDDSDSGDEDAPPADDDDDAGESGQGASPSDDEAGTTPTTTGPANGRGRGLIKHGVGAIQNSGGGPSNAAATLDGS